MDTHITEEDKEHFKESVRAWIALDDKARKLRLAMRELKLQKAALTQSIKEFMAVHNIDDLNTTQGKIRYQKKTVKAPLTVSELKEKITELASSSDTQSLSVNALSELLFSPERPVREKESLRRIVPRTTMSLAI